MSSSKGKPVSRASGVTLYNVSFAYNRTTMSQDISFEAPPGTRVGIGKDGRRQTTLLADLLQRPPPLVRSNWTALICATTSCLTCATSLPLSSRAVLFSTSIAENIAYARPASDHDIIGYGSQRP